MASTKISYPYTQLEILEFENQKNFPVEKNCEKTKKDGWNFIQPPKTPKFGDDSEKVYVHPLDKSSSSCVLSTKSLEMCTETLGSETGNGIDSNIDEIHYLLLENRSSSIKKQPKTRPNFKKVKHCSTFPPPLTSLSGGDGVQVKTHREGGRLVIKAFDLSSCCFHFQTERKNGRLTLSLPKRSYMDSDFEEEGEVENEAEKGRDEIEGVNGCFLGEKSLIEDGGEVGSEIKNGEWSSNRCDGDRNGNNRLPSLRYCVAIS